MDTLLTITTIAIIIYTCIGVVLWFLFIRNEYKDVGLKRYYISSPLIFLWGVLLYIIIKNK